MSYNVPMHQQSQPAYQLVVDVTEKNGGNHIIITLCSTYGVCLLHCYWGYSLIAVPVQVHEKQ